ncbi:jhy protein homolog [Protopterus annectens]|uniref:jhy protein homolog n=1 Tax=Protopterus annectens TaxID=7888 RepID=UPI001CF92FEB|nr:jhy protein homolog [Protopterus annectens]
MDTHSSPLPRLRAVNRIAHFTKTEKVPENTLSHEEDLHLSLHDSLDSESESLVQERMYQFELQRRIHENEQLVNKTPTENQDDSENEDDNELWDSLEESSNSEGRRSLKLEHVNSILQKNTLSRQHSLNKYADLHYDPNWKNIQEPRWEFTHETRQHLQDSLEDLFEDSSDLADEDESSAGETDNFYIEKSSVSSKASQAVEFSFRDHVNRKQKKALGAGNSNRKQRQSSEAEDKLEQVSTPVYLKEGKTVSSSSLHSPSKSKFGFPMSSGPEDTFNIDPNADCDPPYKRAAVVVQHPSSYQLNDWQPEEKFEVAEKQSMAYKAEMICKRDNGNIPSKQYLPTNSNKVRSIHSPKNTNPKKDIIERNKLTLGVSTRKNGSYVKLLSRRKEDVENKTCLHVAAGQESFQVPSETENTSMDPEERWHQRAQRLKKIQNKTQTDIMQEYGLSKSTISDIWINRGKYKSSGQFADSSKNMQKSPYDDTEEALFLWLKQAFSVSVLVSGAILKEKVVIFANELGHGDFNCSDG